MRRGERIPLHDHADNNAGGLVAQSTVVTQVNIAAASPPATSTPSDSVTSETTFGVSATAGTSLLYSRGDHTHGSPTDPTSEAVIRDIGHWEVLMADSAPAVPVGTFMATANQTVASTTAAYAVAFDAEGDVDGLTHSTVTNNSRVYIDQAGEYLLIASAVYDITSGANKHIDLWLAVDGSPVTNSNTVVEIPTATVEGVLAVAFNYDFTAGQYLELMYHADSTAARFVTTAAGASPTRPASPAVILTVNMVAPVAGAGALSQGPVPVGSEDGTDWLYGWATG